MADIAPSEKMTRDLIYIANSLGTYFLSLIVELSCKIKGLDLEMS